MGATSNETKQRWNSNHYTQVKISVSPELAAAFKAKCAEGGVSMAGELSGFMRAWVGSPAPAKAPDLSSRRLRRKALKALIPTIEEIMDAESLYMGNIPENLQGSRFHEAAEQAVSALGEALDSLNEAYG